MSAFPNPANSIRIKVFANFDYEMENLENEVNNWLAEQPDNIIVYDMLYQYALGGDASQPGDPGTGIFSYTVIYGGGETVAKAKPKAKAKAKPKAKK